MPFAPLRHTSRYAFPICIAIVPLSANWGRHAPTRLSVFRMTRHMRNVTRGGGTPHGGESREVNEPTEHRHTSTATSYTDSHRQARTDANNRRQTSAGNSPLADSTPRRQQYMPSVHRQMPAGIHDRPFAHISIGVAGILCTWRNVCRYFVYSYSRSRPITRHKIPAIGISVPFSPATEPLYEHKIPATNTQRELEGRQTPTKSTLLPATPSSTRA